MVKVAATATPGTTIHTAVSGTTDYDEIYLHAINTSASLVNLTIEWGGTTSPDDLVIVGVPGQSGLLYVIPGWILQNGLLVRAFAGAANAINIGGYVHRITA